MRIWFDTNRLVSLNLAPTDIIAAIHAQNVAGRRSGASARGRSATTTQFQFNLQTQGRLVTPAEFGDIVLRANPDGSVLRLRDVARVELGAQNMDSEARLNGKPAVPIGIYLAPGANAVQAATAVAQTLDKLRGRFPPGLHAQVIYDSTSFVRDTIHEVIRTLGIAFVLVVLVVFLFLGNVRATIIPTVAVPVSLIGAFAVLLALGYSANTISLLAMVLAIGIVVDDAIVVVENVERVMEEHPNLSPTEATKKAMRQITGPIIAITLVLLSVFVPVAFIPGLSGTLFRQFAVTISAAMLISAINALTLSPALCAVFLRHVGQRRGPMGWVLQRHRQCARRLCPRGAAPGARGLARLGRDRRLRRRRPSICRCTRRPDFCRRRTRARSSSPRNCPTAPRSRAPARWCAGGGRCCDAMPQVQDTLSIIGFSLLDGGLRAERGVHGGAAEAVRRSHRRGRRREGADRRAASARCSRSVRR